jgi:hypothetical protein
MYRVFSWKSAAVCAGLLVLGMAPAKALTPGIRADIPFAFTAANQTLPPGEYRFSVDSDQRVVRITEEHGRKMWLVRMIAGGEVRDLHEVDKGMLRFTRRGQFRDLDGLWLSGSTLGNAVMRSKVKRELSAAPVKRDVVPTR